MALSLNQQIWQQITQVKKIAIFMPSNRNVVAGAWALQYLIYQQQIDSQTFSENTIIPQKLNFLPYKNPVFSDIQLEYINKINIKINNKNIKSLKYELENLNQENVLILEINANEHLNQKDLILGTKTFNYDLIITLNTSHLETLGGFYVKDPKFFKNTPIINIDIDPSNELYGHLNFVKIQENSISNLIYELYQEFSPQSLNRNSTSLLLSQLLLDNSTEANFKNHPQIKELIHYGADYRLVMDNLFHQNDHSYLQSLGTVLKNLEINNKIARTMISKKNIPDNLDMQHFSKQIIADMLQHIKEIKVLLFSLEDNNEWKHIIYDFSNDNNPYYKLNKHYHILGMNQNQIVLSTPLEDIDRCQEKIIRYLQN